MAQAKDESVTISIRTLAVAGAVAAAGISAGLTYLLLKDDKGRTKTANADGRERWAPVPVERAASDDQLMSGLAEEMKNLRSFTEDNRKLAEENARLQRLVTLAQVTQLSEDEINPALSLAEVETMKAIFEMFDSDQDGLVEIQDLSAMHKKLGEPLSEDEAKAAMSQIDKQKNGVFTFNEFLGWWYENNFSNKKGDRYTARFKFMRAKLMENDFETSRVKLRHSGKENTTEYRVGFQYKMPNGNLKDISPWHDIPLHAVGTALDGKIFNFVCEIPKWTRAKYEIATGEQYNPIKQDVKHGQLRFYKYGDMMFNYGAFPRTWEDPSHVHPDTKHPGDNDPIDVIEIGTRQLPTGSITRVKILGVLALIDDNETDWKIIAISIADALAQKLNDIDDVDTYMPGAINAIREYLRVYKVVSGGNENTFALRGECKNRNYAIQVVEDCHKSWQKLQSRGQTEVAAGGHPVSAAPTQ